MQELGITALSCAVTFIITALLSAIIALIKTKGKEQITRTQEEKQRDEALLRGARTILRKELLDVWERCSTVGSVHLYELEHAERVYNSYHSIGGNGTGTQVFNKIKELPIAPSSNVFEEFTSELEEE